MVRLVHVVSWCFPASLSLEFAVFRVVLDGLFWRGVLGWLRWLGRSSGTRRSH